MEGTVREVKIRLRLLQCQGYSRGRAHLKEGIVKGVAENAKREELNQQLLTLVTFEKAISGEQWE